MAQRVNLAVGVGVGVGARCSVIFPNIISQLCLYFFHWRGYFEAI